MPVSLYFYGHLQCPREILAIMSTLVKYIPIDSYPSETVLLHNDTGPSNPKRPRMTDGESRQPEVTKPPKMSVLLKELLNKVSAKWENIGLLLDLEIGQLDAIKSGHRDPHECFREMLKLWLKQVDPLPTWSAIIEAIEVEYKSLAEELSRKYCN